MLYKHVAHPHLWLDDASYTLGFTGSDGKYRKFGWVILPPERLETALLNRLVEHRGWQFLDMSTWDMTITIDLEKYDWSGNMLQSISWDLKTLLKEINTQGKTFNSKSKNYEIHYQEN